MISVTGKIKQGRERGSASGGGEVSIFNTVFRKASLGCNISAGPEKSDRESQRVSERTPCVWDSGVAFRKKALPWHAVKGSLKEMGPGDGTIGTNYYYVQHAQIPSNCLGIYSLHQRIRKCIVMGHKHY